MWVSETLEIIHTADLIGVFSFTKVNEIKGIKNNKGIKFMDYNNVGPQTKVHL